LGDIHLKSFNLKGMGAGRKRERAKDDMTESKRDGKAINTRERRNGEIKARRTDFTFSFRGLRTGSSRLECEAESVRAAPRAGGRPA
jgi:hypothetical protein